MRRSETRPAGRLTKPIAAPIFQISSRMRVSEPVSMAQGDGAIRQVKLADSVAASGTHESQSVATKRLRGCLQRYRVIRVSLLPIVDVRRRLAQAYMSATALDVGFVANRADLVHPTRRAPRQLSLPHTGRISKAPAE
jgi:hypothetical protein